MKSALAAACALLSAAAAHAGDAAVEVTINKFSVAFNKGDTVAAKALHVASPTITDEVAPHHWSGPKAFDTWLADLTKSETAEGKSDGQVTLGAPTREVVEASTAYVIVPSTYIYKQKGMTFKEVAQMTFALAKTPAGWKIAAWTWTGAAGVPVKK